MPSKDHLVALSRFEPQIPGAADHGVVAARAAVAVAVEVDAAARDFRTVDHHVVEAIDERTELGQAAGEGDRDGTRWAARRAHGEADVAGGPAGPRARESERDHAGELRCEFDWCREVDD